MRTKNIGTLERVGRVLGGATLVALGVPFLVGASDPFWLIAVGVVLIALGLDFAVTGVTGHCLIYRWLGRSTARREIR